MNNYRSQLLLLIAAGLLVGAWATGLAQQPMDYQYVYDGNGQLVRAIDSDGNVVTYEYDASGNIVAITRSTTADLAPPQITGVAPDVVNQGETVDILITGRNLLVGSLTLDNPEITILGTRATDTQLTATFLIPQDAPLGIVTLTVMTSLGDDSATITVKGPRPMVSGIRPSDGPSTGGTAVTLSGTNFTPDTTITIGGNPATDVVFVTAEMLTARTPAGTLGPADVEVSNGNGSTSLPERFLYTVPFSTAGAVAIETGGTGILPVTLVEPAPDATNVTLASNDQAVATVPASVTIPAGERTATVVVTGVAEGATFIVATVRGVDLLTSVFVTAPFAGDVDLVGSPVGIAFGGRPVASPVGVVFPTVPLPAVLLGTGETKTVTLQLSAPAPAGGLCVTLVSSNTAVATVPAEVCLDEGEQTVSFSVTAIATGEVIITLTAGTEVLEVRVLVNLGLGATGGGLAAPVGVLVTPTTEGPTFAPIVGVEVQ